MKIKISKLVFLSLGLIITACKTPKFSEKALNESEQQLNSLRAISIKENKIPRTIEKDGTIRWVLESYDWTKGFWPGVCWMQYENTLDPKWKEAAESNQKIFSQ